MNVLMNVLTGPQNVSMAIQPKLFVANSMPTLALSWESKRAAKAWTSVPAVSAALQTNA
jgi:hypothetical protein